jgi:GntR family transcriptional regulator
LPDPRWKQIALDLRAKIETGQLGSDGDALPNEQDLVRTYRASRNTVRDALKWLGTRGEVYARSGAGTFISPRPAPFVTELSAAPYRLLGDNPDYREYVSSRGKNPELSGIEIKVHSPGDVPMLGRRVAALIDKLQLPAGELALSRFQVRYINDEAQSLQTTYYPMSFVSRGAERLMRPEVIQPGAVSYIEEQVGVKEMGWLDRLAVRVPDPSEAALLGLPDDGRVQVIEIVRVGYDESARPIRATATTYRADTNQFEMKFGQLPPEDGDLPGRPEPVGTRKRTHEGAHA